MKVLDEKGIEIGITTSGTFSPSLKKGLGLAWIDANKIKHGQKIRIEIRGQAKEAIVYTQPFIPGSIRKN